MKHAFSALLALFFVAVLMSESAEAARVGGGRSMGMQRSAPMQRQATPPAASQQQAKPAAPAAAPAPAGNRWLGPIAGLAAGLGLGWLLGQGGMGGMGGFLGTMLMALLAGAVVMFLVRRFVRPREPLTAPMQYADLGGERAAAPMSSTPSGGAQAVAAGGFAARIPAGFDAEGFLKQAKRNFLQVQEANDRANLDELREVTTPEMFESLKGDVVARGSRQQQTEIISLEAELLEVVTEGSLHWASVRFSGTQRETPRSAPEPFEEAWNLQKPVSGETGWLLAGIQQMA